MGNTESFMGASLEIETSRRDTRTSEESSLAGESYATDECRSWALPKLMMEAETMEHAESYQEAEELYQTMAQYLEEGSVEMATLQDRMGCLFVRTGRLVEAMKCFRKALNIKKRRSPHSSSVAKTMGNIASVYCGKVSL
jgi:tetratricopeptide (TPR) repeat protein